MNPTRIVCAYGAFLMSLALSGCARNPPRTSVQPPVCRADQLTLRAGLADAGMGHVTRTLVVERRGTDTCRLTGTPRLQLLDAHGAPLRTVQRNAAAERIPTMIRLAPGAAAHFTVHYANATGYAGPGEPRCPTAKALAVSLPGTKSTLRLILSIDAYGGRSPAPVCGELWVSALKPGVN